MTAANPSQLAHLCAVAAGRSVIVALANRALVASRLACSDDTLDRLLTSTSERQWTYPRLLDLAALERDVLGTDRLDRALDERRAPRAPRREDPTRVGFEAIRRLGGLLTEIGDDLEGGLDTDELARICALVPAARAVLDRLTTAAAERGLPEAR